MPKCLPCLKTGSFRLRFVKCAGRSYKLTTRFTNPSKAAMTASYVWMPVLSGHHPPRRDRGGFACQHQEGVLGVVVAEQAAADGPDHRPVPPHQRGEGGLVAVADKGAQ